MIFSRRQMHVRHIMEQKFTDILWVVAMWVLVTWFAPLLVVQTISRVWPHRDGLFMDIGNYKGFHMATDSLYVFLITYVVVMLVVSLAVTGVYLYSQIRYQRNHGDAGMPFHKKLWFRATVLVVTFIFMILVSVGSIVQVSCVDNVALKEHAVALRYPPYTAVDFPMTRKYAKYAYQMAIGYDVEKPFEAPGTMFFSESHVVMADPKMHAIKVMSNASLESLAVAGNLWIKWYKGFNGQAAAAATYMQVQNASMLTHNTDHMYTYYMDGAKMKVVTPDYPIMNTAVSNVSMGYDLASEGLTESDVHEESTVRYILMQMGNSNPTTLDMVTLMAKDSFKAGLAYAYLLVTHESVKHSGRFNKAADLMDIQSTLDEVARCQVSVDYVGVIFLVMLVVSFIMQVVLLVSKKCRKKGYTPLNREDMAGMVSGDEASEHLYNSGEEGDRDSEWDSVTSFTPQGAAAAAAASKDSSAPPPPPPPLHQQLQKAIQQKGG